MKVNLKQPKQTLPTTLRGGDLIVRKGYADEQETYLVGVDCGKLFFTKTSGSDLVGELYGLIIEMTTAQQAYKFFGEHTIERVIPREDLELNEK